MRTPPYPTQSYLKKRTMKPFRAALFALIVLLSAACSRPASDIVESSTNGLSGVRMPVQVTLREGVELAEDDLEDAVSFTPSADVEVSRLGVRTLRIVPKSPLKSDTRYKVALDASKLTGGKAKGVAEFEFSTPKLRFSYNPCWLQQSDDLKYYVLVGETVSSDYAADDYVEQRLKIKGLLKPEVTWTHSEDGTVHKYRVENIPTRSDESYKLTLDFDLDPKRNVEMEVPRKGEYIVLDHTVQTEPLAVVVTFSEPLKPNQDFRNLIRFDPKFRTSVDRNRLYIYPETQLTGNYEVEISREVQNKAGRRLDESYTFTAALPSQAPAIRFTGKGSILPSSNRMSLLFESVNFARARVRVRKIFANNLLQFFQRNYYGDTYFSDMEYVSRIVRDTTIDLGDKASTRLDRTNSYSLDLSRLITDSRKSMYLLEIKGVDPLIPVESNDYDYYFGDYRTYAERSKVVIQSDIGIICKSSGDGELIVYTTDLVSARPKGSCKVRAYDRQNQQLAEAVTDSEGRAVLKCGDEPYTVLAEANGDAAFVRVERGAALSLSNFDVGGTTDTKGIKGYLFGERGVWRPGDEIYLTLIVASDNPLPENHPASLEFYNPNGQLVQSAVSSGSTDGIHTFKLRTTPASPTGIWRAKATFGGATFEKNIRVDAVKPNRMKIEMRLGDGQTVDAKEFTGRLTARWLHGAPAAGSKVTLQAQLSQIPTRFKGYPDYSFDDATKQFAPEEREIVSGTTGADGALQLTTDRLSSLEGLSPGMLNGKFTVKVFEKSGDFSVDQQIAAVSPYDAYFGIGVTAQQSDWGEEYLDSKRDHALRLVLLDARGRPATGTEEATVTVYRMSSYWWWDASSAASQARYAKSALNAQYKTLRATLSNGTGQVTMRWSAGDSGYYLIRVTGARQAHSATCVVCVSSSDHRGGISSVTDAATRLAIARDKDKYVPGDKAKITIPSSPGARALVSVESGSFVRESRWIACTDRQTSFEIPVREGMAPNVYVSVTLVQPHGNTLNDAPIRLFGVLRLPVEDAGTRLAPVVEMPESVKPESEITIRVRERNGRRMSYVLALVDEGLLGLTRFRTPDPYLYFNATEALGVRTWDLFDHVIGAYGGPAVQTRRAVPRRREAGRREDQHPQDRAAALLRVGARDGRSVQRPRLRLRGERGRREKTAPGAGDPAPRGLHGGGDRTSGHGLRPRKRGRQNRRPGERERSVLRGRAAEPERRPRRRGRTGRHLPAQGGPADRNREGPRLGGLFRRQLRLGDRDRRAGAESLRHDLGRAHPPAGRNGLRQAPESLRNGPSGAFVDSSDRPFAPPRIPRALPPRLHRTDHLGSLPATLPTLHSRVRRRDVTGHRPQYQERPVAAGRLSALQRRIRLLERRNFAFGMGHGLRGPFHGRSREIRLRRRPDDARTRTQIPARQHLRQSADAGLRTIRPRTGRHARPGRHESPAGEVGAGRQRRAMAASRSLRPRRQPEGGRRADRTDRRHGGSEGRPLRRNL